MEMLIVVIILGVLASIIIPNLMQNLKNTRDSARDAQMASLKNALDAYYIDKWRVPEPDAQVTITWANGVVIYQWIIWTGVATELGLDRIPTDPATKTNYVYSVNSTYQKYGIFTFDEEWNPVYRGTNPIVLDENKNPLDQDTDLTDANNANATFYVIEAFTGMNAYLGNEIEF